MKVFLDTNVLLSALLTRGNCSLILGHCLEHHDIMLSETVLEEFSRKALGKLKASAFEVSERVAFFRKYAIVAEEPVKINRRCRDPKDDRILAAASASSADCLITGDKEILSLAGHFPIPIIPPGRFFAFEAGWA